MYCYDTDGNNTEIAYNYIHDNLAKTNGVGIYLDENNQNHNLNHNLVTNCSVGINLNKPSTNTLVYHNTLNNNTYSMGAWGNSGDLVNVYTFNNLTDTDKKLTWNYDSFYGNKMDSNYLYTSPIFIDTKNQNFNLKPNVPPVNSGVINQYTVDYIGDRPDKGAFEFGKAPWKAGSTIVLKNKINQQPYNCNNLNLIKNTSDSVFLTWDYVHGDIDSFYVERKLSTDQTYTIIARLDSSILQFNDTITKIGKYRYQIVAKNSFGISDPSNSVEVFKTTEKEVNKFLDAANNDLQKGTIITNEILGSLDNKDWIAYLNVNFNDSTYDACKIRMGVPCNYAWQNIQLRIDNYMGRIIGEFITENTGGWDQYEIKQFPIEKISGNHDLYIKFRGKFGVANIDWFQLFNSNGSVVKTINKDSKCPEPFDASNEIPVKLFPNPGDDILRVSFENREITNATVEIYNSIGIKISEQNFQNLYPGEAELYVLTEQFKSNTSRSFYLIKVKIESENHNQETVLKYIRI